MGTAMVSLVFCDLVDSTALLSRLGDEAGDAMRRTVFEALRGAVTESGGEEVKNLGDGLMVVCTGASDAIACGVAMQRAVARLRRRGGDVSEVVLRVGISAGEATHEDGDWFGTPVVEAARLCAAARPGQVLVADLVRMLAGSRGGHAFSAPVPYELKGLREPVPACSVEWIETTGDGSILPPALAADGAVTFVGRSAERERLQSAWKQAREGQRALALLAGEPGAGKTRLAGELARQALEDEALVLFGRCDEELGVPYQPFAEALHAFVDTADGAELGRHPGELRHLLPELGELVPGVPEATVSDPQTQQYRLFEAVSSWLSAAGEQRPVLLVLDDLHWASKPTLLLLRHISRHPEGMRLLVVGTYRDTDLDRLHPLAEMLADLRREPDVQRIALAGLDSGEVASLLEAMSGHDLDERAAALAHAVHAETDGNPFFVGEVLRHLVETGVLYDRDGRWTSDRGIDEAGIPEGVREVVGRRVSRLSDGADEVLRAAAAIGQEFDLQVLLEVAGAEQTVVERILEEAVTAHLLVEVPGRGLRQRFAHALVRTTLYEELPSLRRVRLHRAVAEAIERVHAARLEDRAAELAHHWGEAAASGSVDEAVHWATRAGEQCLARLADAQAITWLERGLELLDEVAEPADSLRRCDLLMRLGEARRRIGEPYSDATLTAADIARAHGDGERLARALLSGNRGFWSSSGRLDPGLIERIEAALELVDADGETSIRLQGLLAQELTFGPDRERAIGLAGDAVARARALGDEALLLHVLALALPVVWAPSQAEDRLVHLAETIDLADRLGDPRWAAQARLWHWSALFESGRYADALEVLADATERVRALGHATMRWLVTCYEATLAMYRGEFDAGKRHMEEALAVGQAAGEPDAGSWAAAQFFGLSLDVGLGLGPLADAVRVQADAFPGAPAWRAALAAALADAGRMEEATAVLDELAAQPGFSMPLDLNWHAGVNGLALAVDNSRRADLAGPLYELLLPYSGRLHFHGLFIMGSVDLNLGRLSRILGQHERALTHLTAARQLHERTDSPRWAAHVDREVARVFLERGASGDRERATTMLDNALANAERLGMDAFIARTKPLIPA